MFIFNGQAPVKIREDSLLPDLPTEAATEEWLFTSLAYLQKWGFLACLILIVICFFMVKLFKIRKNPQLVRMWKFWAYGFAFIGIFFAVLPYIIIRFY
jgi:hypothetical protein